jgi:hypothetical protein
LPDGQRTFSTLEEPMADIARTVKAQLADLAAIIERTTADLSLAEEPASFLVAIEEAADDE